MNFQDDLLEEKQANLQYGSTSVAPMTFGNAGGGTSDPDPSMAFNSMNTEMRTELNFANYTHDMPISGTGLRPYAEMLNQNDQTINYLSTSPELYPPVNKPVAEESAETAEAGLTAQASLGEELNWF